MWNVIHVHKNVHTKQLNKFEFILVLIRAHGETSTHRPGEEQKLTSVTLGFPFQFLQIHWLSESWTFLFIF
jgi:hypothetical protein